MKRADWIFAIGAIGVLLFFIGLSRYGGRQPTPMPHTPDHQTAKTRDECLACHHPDQSDAVKPISAHHPQAWKDERFICTACHQMAQP